MGNNVYSGMLAQAGGRGAPSTISTRCGIRATKPRTWGESIRSTTWFSRRKPRLRTMPFWRRVKPMPLRTHLM